MGATKSFSIARNNAIRATLQAVIDRDFDGNANAARKRLGVSQTMVSDVLRGAGAGMTIVDALADYLGEGVAVVLGEATPSGEFPMLKSIAAIEARWRREGAWDEAIALWRTKIGAFSSSSNPEQIPDVVNEMNAIKMAITAGLLTREGCIAAMQEETKGKDPTPPPHDDDAPPPPKKKTKQ